MSSWNDDGIVCVKIGRRCELLIEEIIDHRKTKDWCSVLDFVFSCELANIAAIHHMNTLGSSMIVGMHVRIGTIPQA